MPRCAIDGCRMSQKMSKVIGLNAHFFRIPSRGDVRSQWISKCRSNISLKKAIVCSIHFEESDFERDLKAELLNLRPRTRLKKNAVPSLKLGEVQDLTTVPSPASSPVETILIKVTNEDDENRSLADVACQTDAASLSTNVDQTSKIRQLEVQLFQLTLQNEQLKQSVHQKDRLLIKQKCQINSLSQGYKIYYKESEKSVNDMVKKKLSGSFTNKEMNRILTPQKQVRWSEDLSK